MILKIPMNLMYGCEPDYKTWKHFLYDDNFTNEIHEWLDENIKNKWSVFGISGFIGCEIFFEKNEDMVAFKLRWL